MAAAPPAKFGSKSDLKPAEVGGTGGVLGASLSGADRPDVAR